MAFFPPNPCLFITFVCLFDTSISSTLNWRFFGDIALLIWSQNWTGLKCLICSPVHSYWAELNWMECLTCPPSRSVWRSPDISLAVCVHPGGYVDTLSAHPWLIPSLLLFFFIFSTFPQGAVCFFISLLSRFLFSPPTEVPLISSLSFIWSSAHKFIACCSKSYWWWLVDECSGKYHEYGNQSTRVYCSNYLPVRFTCPYLL